MLRLWRLSSLLLPAHGAVAIVVAPAAPLVGKFILTTAATAAVAAAGSSSNSNSNVQADATFVPSVAAGAAPVGGGNFPTEPRWCQQYLAQPQVCLLHIVGVATSSTYRLVVTVLRAC